MCALFHSGTFKGAWSWLRSNWPGRDSRARKISSSQPFNWKFEFTAVAMPNGYFSTRIWHFPRQLRTCSVLCCDCASDIKWRNMRALNLLRNNAIPIYCKTANNQIEDQSAELGTHSWDMHIEKTFVRGDISRPIQSTECTVHVSMLNVYTHAYIYISTHV
jgi:hypothetical protein